MKTIVVYLRLYGDCVKKSVLGARRSAWTFLLPVLLFTANALLIPLVAPLGIIGSFIIPLIEAAIISCYLYFVGEIVAGSPVRLDELQRSIAAYFWSVINVMFVLWIVDIVLGLVLRGPNAGLIGLIISLAELVLLNVVPEVIYQKGTYGGLATIQTSIEFIQQNWIEWYLPNAVLFAGLWAILYRLPQLGYAAWFVAGAVLHLGMIFRGHLFDALDGSSHRQRMFKYRNAA